MEDNGGDIVDILTEKLLDLDLKDLQVSSGSFAW